MTFKPFRQQDRLHPVKMFFLAKKMGVVRGNDVHQMAGLLASGIRLQHLAIFPVAADFKHPQSLGHPGAHQRTLVRTQIDAAVLINQPAQKFVIGICKHLGCGL